GTSFMRSQGVVFTGPNRVSYQAVECPDPGPSDVLVRITHSWISNGTEGSYLRGERSDGDTPYREGDPVPFPVVAGYQKIGVVEEAGENVHDLRPGETVFATIGLVKGMHHNYGGHVSPSVCPREQVWKLPSGTDPLAYAGMVLAQVGFNGGMRAQIEAGDPALVFGDGMVGHWTAQTLAWRGAEVLLVGRHDERLRLFADRPHRHAVNTVKSDWREYVKSHFAGSLQVAVDSVGRIELLESVQPFMRRFGHLVSAGFYGMADRLALQPPRYGELTIHLVSGWRRERMDETLGMIAGGYLETLPLITHHFPVARAADAWNLIESKTEPVLGVILDW
ncbi:MAG TPA: zinc-binding dehydrogenase, partial [Bacteroidota bacterium]|nr:zinc-binding dehydrogenase [Bacteroidota bacterium]